MFYRGTDEFNQIYWSAPEYQLLDNEKAEDNKKDNHLAGSVYDLLAAPKDAAHPAGQWNQTRIIAKGPHVEHWLNGVRVVAFEAEPSEVRESPISLQNHASEVWFRNLRIRHLQ